MMRQIIKIEKEKCNGCSLCVSACHEGAIGLVDGKAVLLLDDYCDGLGNCLPVCPAGAITLESREAPEFNEAEVKKNMKLPDGQHSKSHRPAEDVPEGQDKEEKLPCGCPGTNSKVLNRANSEQQSAVKLQTAVSQLKQWPVQIKLVPVNAAYFTNANLLVSADCAAYAYGNFHNEFMRNKITLIGCPKLDDGDYSDKLTAILDANSIKSITVVRMEVPCCGGIENAVKTALKNSGKIIPWQVVTISTEGELLDL